MIIIVMGVSGSGKTTISKLLAEKLDMAFYDADNFHPISNIRKMKEAVPLDDDDRKPWLELLNSKLKEWQKDGAVLACSALKESYRNILRKGLTDVKWIYLVGSRDSIALRLKARLNHYMSSDLLDSQFDDLEEPLYGIRVDISSDPENIVKKILKDL